MDLDSWMLEYKKICKELGIDPARDREARDIAASLISDKPQPLQKLESLIRHRDVVVFGAGPSLEEGVKNLDKQGKTLIAADGATSCLLENGLYPDIVVTDLDGNTTDLLLADRFGSLMVVHAHGDNIPKLKNLLPKFKAPVVTTQVEPLKNVHNFFGFTDGDRAVFLAKHFGAKNTDLIGFDFGDVVGKYSKPEKPENHPADERKKKKLGIAKRLVEKEK
jgi:uncharacterized Rossmann fold enzyme